MSLRDHCRAALLGLCLTLSFAAAAVEIPTTPGIQSSLSKIAERKLPETEQKAVQQRKEARSAQAAAGQRAPGDPRQPTRADQAQG
ncbi:hypothetical protein WR25_26204 [Diploscapter pachys]|uniref:Uncharacterized protein n=1 Tax=Diploscapter pachys TaxID=2018661 RepID=A0A2A2M5Y0_9BILA|nr:hypothetical protein WR25_26204 [Diploscapter pachys]